MNWLIRMAFDGTNYHGFQVQKNALSVCEVLQNAMEALFGYRPDVKGCSRTDAGVHALDFCASFAADTSLPAEKLPLALNSHLPGDIRVFFARQVPGDFHARYAAQGKEYCYLIRNSAVDTPFAPQLGWRLAGPLDEGAMHAAGQHLLGTHDFAAFVSAGSDVEDTVRTLTHLSVRRRGDLLVLRVAADGFLYNMVRIIGGTLLRAGQGKMPPEQVAEILASRSRAQAGDTLPAQGLFLARVFYAGMEQASATDVPFGPWLF